MVHIMRLQNYSQYPKFLNQCHHFAIPEGLHLVPLFAYIKFQINGLFWLLGKKRLAPSITDEVSIKLDKNGHMMH